MKQTAVEWLIYESMKLVVQYMQGTLNEDTLDNVIYELGTKAKAMEKEQLEDAFVECWKANMPDGFECKLSAKQYYNETFKNKQ